MNAKIVVERPVKRIQINDTNDYIELAVNDTSLMEKFYRMWDNVQKKLADSQEKVRGLKLEQKETTDAFKKVELAMQINVVMTEFCKYYLFEIDRVFGAGTCDKVFGVGVVPFYDTINQFVAQMIPFITEIQQERVKSIKDKYQRRGDN